MYVLRYSNYCRYRYFRYLNKPGLFKSTSDIRKAFFFMSYQEAESMAKTCAFVFQILEV